MKRPEIVSRLREIIHREAPTARVYLYGSEARGDARPDSDIDLLILLDKEKVTFSDQENIAFLLYEVEFDTGVSVIPFITTLDKWENRALKTLFYTNVMNERIEI